ncbi:MAG: hypothetical protein LH647_06040, partial [Leptolyngbyaceae cyanobacterium CAN_BIN12]|nr:hypothetical protein [Leptolyngbyaceae cyanobacterium CAN_BIN12]
ELFAQAEPLLNNAVRFAFLRYHHSPSTDDMERLIYRLSFHLFEDDYRRLRTYDHRQAKLDTWLQKVVNHEVSLFLRQESRQVSLDDAPAEIFTQPPMQEVLLLEKEQRHLLEKVLSKLTLRQRKIFEAQWQGEAAEKTAQEMRIRVATVYRKRYAVLEKILKLIEKEQK